MCCLFYANAEWSAVHFFMTPRNQTHQLTDPTGSKPSQIETFGPDPTKYNKQLIMI